LRLDDETNINTIIYNEVKSDRAKELEDLYQELDKRKKVGLAELRNKTAQIKKNFDKTKDIEKIKSDISQGIRMKIIKSLTPKEGFNKKFDFSSININCKI
jgi:hypothetical protein